MPILPGFDFFVSYRSKVRADLFSKSGGLVGAHGTKWYEVTWPSFELQSVPPPGEEQGAAGHDEAQVCHVLRQQY